MKRQIVMLLLGSVLISCNQNKLKPEQKADQSETEKEDFVELKLTGLDLFNSILDTVIVKSISKDFLINNEWIYMPFDRCESYMKFQDNGKGISYSCEMGEDYEMIYRIEGNRIHVSEYDVPHVNNVEGKKMKYRDDIYIYNGQSLLMINSKMYNIDGDEWTPDIDVVINYKRKIY